MLQQVGQKSLKIQKMDNKIGLFLSALLLVELVFLDFIEARPGCRPGLMMCNRRKGKRQAKVSQQPREDRFCHGFCTMCDFC